MSEQIDLIYRVWPESPQAHLFAVALEIPCPSAGKLLVSMPAWIPGSYMIRDFARNIVSITAIDSAGPVPLEKLDKQSWRLTLGGGRLILSYRVYAWELSVRAAHLDTTHAYFNGPSLFLRVHGLDEGPCLSDLIPPKLAPCSPAGRPKRRVSRRAISWSRSMESVSNATSSMIWSRGYPRVTRRTSTPSAATSSCGFGYARCLPLPILASCASWPRHSKRSLSDAPNGWGFRPERRGIRKKSDGNSPESRAPACRR